MGRLGITFAQRYSIKMLPTHDQLDTAVAAYLAYLFKSRKTCDYGEKRLKTLIWEFFERV